MIALPQFGPGESISNERTKLGIADRGDVGEQRALWKQPHQRVIDPVLR